MLTGSPIVEVNDLIFKYGGAEVLHSISFRLNKGEIVGLLGPNGAGKSTTIKILAGILSQTSGHVSVCGLSLPESAIAIKERIGYVPEAAGLFESLSGQEFLELSGRLHNVEEQTVAYGLTRKCLHDFYVAMTYHLSITSGTSTGIYKEVGEGAFDNN